MKNKPLDDAIESVHWATLHISEQINACSAVEAMVLMPVLTDLYKSLTTLQSLKSAVE